MELFKWLKKEELVNEYEKLEDELATLEVHV